MKVETHEYAVRPARQPDDPAVSCPPASHLPVVVVIHGGYWRSTYGMELAEPLGRDLTRFGVAAAVIEYRRVGEGGGWPTTLADVARAVDSLAGPGQQLAEGRLLAGPGRRGRSFRRRAPGRLARPPRVAAGGHRRVGRPGRGARPDRRRGDPGRVCWTWCPASDERLGNGAVTALMEGEARSLPQRYHHASPLAQVGDGARVVCVHGDADDTVPLTPVGAVRRGGAAGRRPGEADRAAPDRALRTDRRPASRLGRLPRPGAADGLRRRLVSMTVPAAP